MPYTHREVGNKECVFKKDTGKQVGCTTGDINDYLGALHANVKTEEEIEEGIVDIGREKIIDTYNKFIKAWEDEKVRTSTSINTIVKSIRTGTKLTHQEKIEIEKNIISLLKKLGYGAIFVLPGGSLFLIVSGIIKNKMKKNKNKENLTEVNKLKGGKGDKMTPKKIADKFDIDVKDVKKQIEYGKCIECEHTDDEEKAKEIATDHVSEIPDYYNRLDKMEKAAEKFWGKKEKKKKETNESKIFIKKLLRENL